MQLTSELLAQQKKKICHNGKRIIEQLRIGKKLVIVEM